jgi:hypothetical protein
MQVRRFRQQLPAAGLIFPQLKSSCPPQKKLFRILSIDARAYLKPKVALLLPSPHATARQALCPGVSNPLTHPAK